MVPSSRFAFFVDELMKLDIEFPRSLEDLAADFVAFEDLLQTWQKIQNLVSRETLGSFWHRHVLDSLQLLPLLGAEDQIILDIGSGGGFPSIPLAIALKGQELRFNLVESNRRKVSFLRTVSRNLILDLNVHGCRMAQLPAQKIGGVGLFTSRATDSLTNLLAMMHPMWTDSSRALLHKGAEFSVELEEASTKWMFDVVCIPSQTDGSGQILDIRDLKIK